MADGNGPWHPYHSVGHLWTTVRFLDIFLHSRMLLDPTVASPTANTHGIQQHDARASTLLPLLYITSQHGRYNPGDGRVDNEPFLTWLVAVSQTKTIPDIFTARCSRFFDRILQLPLLLDHRYAGFNKLTYVRSNTMPLGCPFSLTVAPINHAATPKAFDHAPCHPLMPSHHTTPSIMPQH